MATSGRTVVLGLGNPVLGDDRIGLAVVAELQQLLAQAPLAGVDVLASTRGGFEFIDLLRGYTRAILIDCLVPPEPVPGRVRRLTLQDVTGSPRLINAHEISIGTAFRLAERLGIPMPAEVEIIAVEAGDTSTLGESLTPLVQATVGPLAREIYDNLKRTASASESSDTEDFGNRRAFYSPDVE